MIIMALKKYETYEKFIAYWYYGKINPNSLQHMSFFTIAK